MLKTPVADVEFADQEPAKVLFRYHVQENHLPSGYDVLLGQGLLLFLAVAGVMYSKPAMDFADHENLGIDRNTQAALNAVDTSYSACIVLCAAAIFFYKYHVQPQEVPLELAGIIEPPFTAAEYLRKNTLIGVTAAISAVPFVTIAYIAFGALPAWAFYPVLVYIFSANTFLHFLPIKLILDDPLYGAIPRYLKAEVLRMIGSAPLEKEPPDETAVAQVGALVNALNSHLAELMNDLPNAKSKLRLLKNYTYELFLETATFPVTANAPLSPEEALFARVVGAAFVIVSCLGYIANPFLVFNQEFGLVWWQAALITALPMFFLSVLFTYFGDTMGQQLLRDLKADAHYLHQLVARENNAPAPVFMQSTVFRLYPEAALACMVINIFFAIFAAAAAMEMMHYAFANHVSAQALFTLYVFAQIGVSIVAVYAPLDYQKMVMGYLSIYRGQGSLHEIMVLNEKLAALQADSWRLKPASRMGLLQKKGLTHVQQGTGAKITFGWCCQWFGAVTEVDEPLLVGAEVLNPMH